VKQSSNGIDEQSGGSMNLRTSLIIACTFAAACTNEISTSPQIDVRYAKGGGGKPGGGGSVAITPVQLSGRTCSSAAALATNDAGAVTIGGYCVAKQTSPFIWTPAGSSIIADTGEVLDVALDGAIVGDLDFKPFYRAPNSQPVILPMNGRTWGVAEGVSADGTVAVGNLQVSQGSTTVFESAVWTKNGSAWELGTISGFGKKISADARSIAGYAAGHASVWQYSAGAWIAATLPDAGAISSRAYGINQDGTVIVGQREVPLSDGRPGTYEQPVVWTYDGATWSMSVLQGINIQEGGAYGVATRLDGSIVAVGYAWEDKAGAGQQQWAVAWVKPVGESQFGAPTRLEPVTKGSYAEARDVNARGQIVGTAAARIGSTAVMWQLP
jgi:uncharacterized membrane protein